jgi:hypothetical protein
MTATPEALTVSDREAWLLAIDAVNLLAPEVRDADKIRAAGKLVDLARLVGRESEEPTEEPSEPQPAQRLTHVVYPDGPLLTAACGQEIGAHHTGHYPSSVRSEAAWGGDVCQACLHLLEPS